MNAEDLKAALAHCYGADTWHRYALNKKMLFTDGVHLFAEHAGGGAYWFLDIMATELMDLHRKEEFIAITLMSTGHEAAIIATDGNENELWRRDIEATDCPAGEWEFYLIDNVLMLTSEY